MAQYIPKADVVAEIKRRIKEIPKNETDKRLRAVYGNEAFVLTELLSFLYTLEAKEVDLNEEIESYFKGFGKFPSVGIDDCIDIAKHFFELGLKTQKGENI